MIHTLIKKGYTDNKELAAMALEDYCKGLIKTKGLSRFDGSVDIGVDRMLEFLAGTFPMINDFERGSSQRPFDVWSADMQIAVERKVIDVSSKNEMASTFLSNATIYPDYIKSGDMMLRTNKKDKRDKNIILDALVVVIATHNGIVNDFIIVDGNYWGVTYEDFVSCRNFFHLINDDLSDIINFMSIKHPGELFIERCKHNTYTGVNLQTRKLISLNNPLFFERQKKEVGVSAV